MFFKVVPISGKGPNLKILWGKNKNKIKRLGGHGQSIILDILKSLKCVLSIPQTTILAIIGFYLMDNLKRNSPLWEGGGGNANCLDKSGWAVRIQ